MSECLGGPRLASPVVAEPPVQNALMRVLGELICMHFLYGTSFSINSNTLSRCQSCLSMISIVTDDIPTKPASLPPSGGHPPTPARASMLALVFVYCPHGPVVPGLIGVQLKQRVFLD